MVVQFQEGVEIRNFRSWKPWRSVYRHTHNSAGEAGTLLISYRLYLFHFYFSLLMIRRLCTEPTFTVDCRRCVYTKHKKQAYTHKRTIATYLYFMFIIGIRQMFALGQAKRRG